MTADILLLKIPCYSHAQQIFESNGCKVFRAWKKQDNEAVLIKWHKYDDKLCGQESQLYNEYELSDKLTIASVVQPKQLIEKSDFIALIMADVKAGVFLQTVLAEQQLDFKVSLDLMQQLAEILQQLHHNKIVHRDIRPATILVDSLNWNLHLTGFGLASTHLQNKPIFSSSLVFLDYLAYISPEQTGRMNRDVDYRSDFYSFGVVLYQLLTGQLPFKCRDRVTLINDHLTRKPIAVNQLCPDIPAPVSAIVDKLLQKQPENRYQSAEGLKKDLQLCVKQWRETGTVIDFQLAVNDVFDQFLIPTGLFGREQEIEILEQSFNQVTEGGIELVILSGVAGIGKSTLVREVFKCITAKSGFFIASKFSETDFKSPYSAWIKAFRYHLLNLISQGDAEIEFWRNSLMAELGDDIYFLMQYIPELEQIIGGTQHIQSQQLTESSSIGLTNLMVKFIRAFSRSKFPVTIFLENFQWADTASIELMTFLASSVNCCPGCQHLLIICAYQDGHIDNRQRLNLIRDRAEISSVEIQLKALEIKAINEWFEKIFHVSGEGTLALAKLFYQQADGNPLLIKEIIKSLDQQGLFILDLVSGSWQWDIEKIKTAIQPCNFNTVFSSNFQLLDKKSEQILQLAACIGEYFDIQRLVELSDYSLDQVRNTLDLAIEYGIIIQMDRANTIMESVEITAYQIQQNYRFTHTLVHQSVYQLINENERSAYHEIIGLKLLELLDQSSNDQHIFDCVYQLNCTHNTLENPKYHIRLAHLNLQAGLIADSIKAFPTALVFFNQGLLILEDDGWHKHYALMLQLTTLSAKAAFHTGDYDLVETRYLQICSKVVNIFDKGKVQQIKVNMLVAQHDFQPAIDLMFHSVTELGLKVSVQPGRKSLWLNQVKINRVSSSLFLQNFSQRPFIGQAKQLAIMEIMCHSLKASFHSMSSLFTYTLQTLTLLTFEYGNNPIAATALIGYGGICCEQLEDIETGLEFAQAGTTLLEVLDDTEYDIIAELMLYCFIAPWRQPLADCIPKLERVFQQALSLRDINCAEWSLQAIENYLYFSGIDLSKLNSKMKTYDKLMVNVDKQYNNTFNEVLDKTHTVLTNRSPGACKRSTVQSAFLGKTEAGCNKRGDFQHFFLYFHKAIVEYLFAYYDDAIISLKIAYQQQSSALLGGYAIFLNFYDSLIRIAFLTHQSQQDKKHVIQHIIANQKKMRRWAKLSPDTCQHKFLLINAELASLENKQLQAGKYYEDAIEAVQQTDNLLETALVWELAAGFEIRQGRINISKGLLEKAYQSYSLWNGWAKIRQLNQTYPEQEILDSLDNLSFSRFSHRPENATVDSLKNASHAINILSKASDKETFYQLWIKQISETYVAQRIVLMVKQSEKLSVVAECVEDGLTICAPNQSIESYTIPTSIVSQAISTEQQIVAKTSSEINQYGQDPYFQDHHVDSVLCIPVVDNKEIGCVVYIENLLTQDSFSLFKIELCCFILSLGWYSFKNNCLADNLEKELSHISAERQSFKVTEARLRESKNHIQSVLETSLDAVISIDAKGIVIDWSAKAETIFGWNSKETIGNLLADFIIPEEHRVAHKKGIARFMQTGHGKVVNKRIEITGMRSDGIKIPVELAIAPIFSDGKYIFSAFIRDLTEQKKIETELNQQREALYQSEKLSSLGTLLAGVSHELNNPLSVVVGRSMMLQSEVDDEKTFKTLEIIKNSAERCSRIVKSFLSIARQQKPNYEQIQINELIHKAIDLVAYGLSTDGVECVFDLQENLPAISGDIEQLRQVFSNLILNAHQALQHVEGERQIKLSTRAISEAEIVVTVTDNGPGVTEEIRHRIFDPFYTSKPVGEGTGFGLSYSRGVIETHAGSLQLENPAEGGARFVIQLPVEHFNLQSSKLSSESSQKFKQPFNLLIVDDEQEIAEMLSDILTKEGHQVTLSEDGLSALKICQTKVFDLIISDLHMPKLDGVSFSKQIIQCRPEMEDRIVFITGDSLGMGDSNDIKATGFIVIEKPVIPEEFAASINKILIGLEAE